VKDSHFLRELKVMFGSKFTTDKFTSYNPKPPKISQKPIIFRKKIKQLRTLPLSEEALMRAKYDGQWVGSQAKPWEIQARSTGALKAREETLLHVEVIVIYKEAITTVLPFLDCKGFKTYSGVFVFSVV
jgi:hypothetical protein